MRVFPLVGACSCIFIGCGSVTDPPPPPPPPQITSFSFLSGSWNVGSSYRRADGSTEETVALTVVRASLEGRVRKEQWVGMRDGAPLEMAAMFVASENTGRWIVARGDGVAGTFDVTEGSFTQSVGVFTSRPGTRPDGSLTRETFSDIEEDSFSWRAERSANGGQSWEVYWTMTYTRDPTGGIPTAPAQSPGCAASEYREFDFWEGDWNIGGATNFLRSLVGGCILEENWSSGSEDGTSFNMYDARSGLWTQVWRDTNDFTLVIYGGLVGDKMVMSGTRLNSLQRITWTPNSDGTVRQLGETSGDNGQSWTTSYDLTYVKQ